MADHWIQGAIKHPGSFSAAAKKAGMSTHAFAEKEQSSGSPKMAAKARLALTLASFHHKGK